MKKFTGKVLSIKTAQTAIVGVVRFKVHPLYENRTKRTKRYPVHDATGVATGDVVEFSECRPLSKTKRWIITKVVQSSVLSTQKSKEAPITSRKKGGAGRGKALSK